MIAIDSIGALSHLLLGGLPDLWMLLGGTVIVASGLFVFLPRSGAGQALLTPARLSKKFLVPFLPNIR